MKILDTGVHFVKNIGGYTVGSGSRYKLDEVLKKCNNNNPLVFMDNFFENYEAYDWLPASSIIEYVDTTIEPTTVGIDNITEKVRTSQAYKSVDSIIAVGGGSTMDTAKAVANLLTNPGSAADYQGWDLVKVPSLTKIALPTISGTGAEATRTCVMTNKANGLKLGMNSDYSVFDFVILDPDFLKTVPTDQYFYTAMDAYIHCVESLNGNYRNSVGDALSDATIRLCEEIFSSGEMKSAANREKLMIASLFGGIAIASSYVGLIHPFSAGLSVAYGTKHCIGNCIAITGLKKHYPMEYEKYVQWCEINKVVQPKLKHVVNEAQKKVLFDATIIHEKPLFNALGENYKSILTREYVGNIFEGMC